MKDFVTFEIAYKLKEKGYPLLRVIKQDGSPIIYDLPQNHPNWQNCNAYYVPTVFQVLKWLHQSYHILITVDPDVNDKLSMSVSIYSVDADDYEPTWMLVHTIFYDNDNEIYDPFRGLELGIEYVLDNLI